MSEVDYTKPKMSAVENNEDIRRLHSEISEMRQHLQIQLSDMAAIQERQYFAAQSPIPSKDVTPATLEIRQYLSQLGLTQACNDQLMSSMKTDSLPSENKQMMWTEVLSQLARNIPYDASDMVAKGGIYAFLGTTGVGKTTTIAKLAARYVMENGTKGVVLLTTDNYRIASHNQLKSLASILNIPVKVVETLEELPTLLKGLVDHQLILIDTPGMGHADPLLKPHLSQLNQCHGVQNVLVLSATSQYQMMKASLHSYRSANLKGCVLTKLDECASLGDAMSMLSEHHLSLSYITNGQSVPDDIATFKSSQLVSRAVAMLKEQKSHHLQAQQTI